MPLFPAMVGAGWVDGGGAGLLGAANFTGYVAGVLGGRALAARVGVPRALDVGMLLVALAFAACALRLGLSWFVLWRALAGLAGGLLMVLAGPAVQAVMEPARRGMASGIVVTGVGTGVATAALLVPALLGQGLAVAWLGLAGAVALVWLGARRWWPDPPPVAPAESGLAVPPAWRLLVAYGLSGAGMVAPMVYMADLAVRGRGLPVAMASLVWLLFGAGAMVGTLSGGRVAGRIGGLRALPLWLGVQVLALGAALLPVWPALLLAGLLGGFAGIGATAVTLAAARDLAGPRAGVIWLRATAAYAVTQALVAFGLAALFAATGESHAAVFLACLLFSALALLVLLAPRRWAGPLGGSRPS